ncbi:MAG: Iron-sulfur flavoprotein [Methanomassiliicoccales archaeon PtaU1.Bin124]|nr:MAG: Iron-sulfur flavoprotein [Methanomassiliicoccales archaeon PtaU1.Bin124]
MYVLGVSGSPVIDSNTDRIVKAIMAATGAENREFIKLSDVNVGPCRAHMKCVENNRCDIDDDFASISRKVLRADALILGTPTYYSAPSSFMKSFVERCYSFRHQRLMLKGKLCATVAVGSASESLVSEWLEKTMTFEGLEVVGAMTAKGTICCLNCGHGNDCPYPAWNTFSKERTGIEYGIKEAYTKYLEVLPDNVPYEKGAAVIKSTKRDAMMEAEVAKRAEALGKRLRTRHDEKMQRLVRV